MNTPSQQPFRDGYVAVHNPAELAGPAMRVTITWNAGFGRELSGHDLAELAVNGQDASVSKAFDLPLPPGQVSDQLEALFEATNLYRGDLWDAMTAQGLPARRTHTALSVGDVVEVHGCPWRCDALGWSPAHTDPLAPGWQDTADLFTADPQPPMAR